MQGKDISNLEDLDKEIALFKASLTPAQKGSFKKDEKRIAELLINNILPFHKELEDRLIQFNELFVSSRINYVFNNPQITAKLYNSYDQFEKDINDFLSKGLSNFSFIKYTYTLNNFKSVNGSRTISIPFTFSFKDYFYEFEINDFNSELSFEKTYDQFFLKEERDRLIEVIIKMIIEKIKSFSK